MKIRNIWEAFQGPQPDKRTIDFRDVGAADAALVRSQSITIIKLLLYFVMILN